MNNEQPENIEQEPIYRDISSDYERIMAEEHGSLKWHDFLMTLKDENLMLKIDLSEEADEYKFTRKANFMKAFREGGISKKHPPDYKGQRRIAIIKCTRKQKYGDDPSGKRTTGWAANAFASDVEWEEVAD